MRTILNERTHDSHHTKKTENTMIKDLIWNASFHHSICMNSESIYILYGSSRKVCSINKIWFNDSKDVKWLNISITTSICGYWLNPHKPIWLNGLYAKRQSVCLFTESVTLFIDKNSKLIQTWMLS